MCKMCNINFLELWKKGSVKEFSFSDILVWICFNRNFLELQPHNHPNSPVRMHYLNHILALLFVLEGKNIFLSMMF